MVSTGKRYCSTNSAPEDRDVDLAQLEKLLLSLPDPANTPGGTR